MTPTTLNVLGLIANIAGTIMLAISISDYIKAMRLAIDAHEIYILSKEHPFRPVVQVTGTEVHMDKGRTNMELLTKLGIILVVSGFVLQLCSYFV